MANSEDNFDARTIEKFPFALVITDPNAPDNPIIYVNPEFERITLYSRQFCVGRNCRFLQGPDTDPADVEALRDGIAKRENVSVDILNYRADGASFHNRLLISPLFDSNGKIANFFGIQRVIPQKSSVEATNAQSQSVEKALMEIQHRVKNHLAMVVSMIRLHARSKPTEELFANIGRRVEALALLYEELTQNNKSSDSALRDTVLLGAYLSRVASTIIALDGRSGVRVNIDCVEISVDTDLGAQIGLLLSELLTNALRHAFHDRDEGSVEIKLQKLSGNNLRLIVSDDGVGFPQSSTWPNSTPKTIEESDSSDSKTSGMGARIVRGLTQGLGATLNVNGQSQGTMVVVDVPYGYGENSPNDTNTERRASRREGPEARIASGHSGDDPGESEASEAAQ